MAFNAGYYPQYPSYMMPFQSQPQQQPQPQQNSGVIWVQGEAGAKSYLVAPNTTIQLWDSESQTIFLKSADASGMPSMKILDYTIRDTSSTRPQVAPQPGDFVTKSELTALESKLNAKIAELAGGHADESTV